MKRVFAKAKKGVKVSSTKNRKVWERNFLIYHRKMKSNTYFFLLCRLHLLPKKSEKNNKIYYNAMQ